MKQLFLLLILSFCCSANAQEPVQVKSYKNLDSLVKGFLLGKGILCQNVKFSGSRASIGTFSFAFESANFKEGLLLCTGKIEDIEGPNNNTAMVLG